MAISLKICLLIWIFMAKQILLEFIKDSTNLFLTSTTKKGKLISTMSINSMKIDFRLSLILDLNGEWLMFKNNLKMCSISWRQALKIQPIQHAPWGKSFVRYMKVINLFWKQLMISRGFIEEQYTETINITMITTSLEPFLHIT